MSQKSDTEVNLQVPKPGIYEDVPFETYLSWDAISNSKINLALRSMLHFKHTSPKETQTLRIGSFIHCGVLEPLAIAQRYAVMPAFEHDPENITKDGSRSRSTATKYVERKREEFQSANSGKIFVEHNDYKDLLGIAKSLSADTFARSCLSGLGRSELSIVWNDPETGLLCKARIDYLTSVIADLKTTEDASQSGFEKSIARYGYHRQGAHYRNGWEVLTGEILPFVIVAVEKSSPYAVSAQPVDTEALEVGAQELSETLVKIADSKGTNVYKSYENNGKWRLPEWYKLPEVQLILNGQSLTI